MNFLMSVLNRASHWLGQPSGVKIKWKSCEKIDWLPQMGDN
jgi:hypothetical protein